MVGKRFFVLIVDRPLVRRSTPYRIRLSVFGNALSE